METITDKLAFLLTITAAPFIGTVSRQQIERAAQRGSIIPALGRLSPKEALEVLDVLAEYEAQKAAAARSP